MPIRALLFDMDGLLVDTEALHLGAFATVATEAGVPCAAEDLHGWVGKGQHRLSAWIQAEAPGPVAIDDLLARQRVEFFRRLDETRPAPQPGIADWLEVAAAEGLATGLVSNSDRELVTRTMAYVLRELGRGPDPAATFGVVVTRDDVRSPKPDPEPYLKAAGALGVAPAECLVFEDSPSGAEAARAAGCRLVVVACPYLVDPAAAKAPADRCFDSMREAAAARVWAEWAG